MREVTVKKDVAKEVTQTILAQLGELQEAPERWRKPWTGTLSGLVVRSNGDAFTGVNVFLLWMRGHQDPRWYTFDQAKEALGYVRNPEWSGKKDTYRGVQKWIWKGDGEDPRHGVKKGERGTMVVRMSPVRIYEDSNGERVYPPKGDKAAWESRLASGEVQLKASFSVPRYYTVFNAEQINGLPQVISREIPASEKYESVMNLLKESGADITFLQGGDKACYSVSQDVITMPAPEQFETEEHFLSTVLHELVHWTGHGSRMGRKVGSVNKEWYAFEELVAELGSAILCATFGVEGGLQHPEYIAHWIQHLKSDDKAFMRAAGEAQRAVAFLLQGTDS